LDGEQGVAQRETLVPIEIDRARSVDSPHLNVFYCYLKRMLNGSRIRFCQEYLGKGLWFVKTFSFYSYSPYSQVVSKGFTGYN
jgi:hypothetical protein